MENRLFPHFLLVEHVALQLFCLFVSAETVMFIHNFPSCAQNHHRTCFKYVIQFTNQTVKNKHAHTHTDHTAPSTLHCLVLGDCCKRQASYAYPIFLPQHWCLFFFFFSVASVKKENAREGNLTVIAYRGGGRTTCTFSHLICTVYSGQDLMLMRGGSQLYISRCKGKFCLLRCKNTIAPSNTLSLTVCVCPKCVHSSVYVLCTEYMHAQACVMICLGL